MIILEKGRYRARLADGQADIATSLALRARYFAADRTGPDTYDTTCGHVLIEDRRDGSLAGTFRLKRFRRGDDLSRSYTAQSYDLATLSERAGPMMELGRFCMASRAGDPDILRLAWGAITRRVDADGIEFLFGCTSFPTVDAQGLADTFAALNARHLAPRGWRPRIKARDVVPFPMGPVDDPQRALATMPALLRSYLGMGGRTSDHAVIDREMGAIHVFTGVEIAAIPPVRRRLLRAMAD